MAKKKRTSKDPDANIEPDRIEKLAVEVAQQIRQFFEAGVTEHEIRRAYSAVALELSTAHIAKVFDQPKEKH
jgi:hypothetical protein